MATSNYPYDVTSIKYQQRFCTITGSKCINGLNEENLWNSNARRRRRSLDFEDYEEQNIDLERLSKTKAFLSLLDTPVRTNAPIDQVRVQILCKIYFSNNKFFFL